MTPTMDDEDIERMIDIIGDGDLTAEAQERLHEHAALSEFAADGRSRSK